MTWEYKVEKLKLKGQGFFDASVDHKWLEKELNNWDRKGWDVLSCQLPKAIAGSFVTGKAILVLRKPR